VRRPGLSCGRREKFEGFTYWGKVTWPKKLSGTGVVTPEGPVRAFPRIRVVWVLLVGLLWALARRR